MICLKSSLEFFEMTVILNSFRNSFESSEYFWLIRDKNEDYEEFEDDGGIF
jgi:hypothetical protein